MEKNQDTVNRWAVEAALADLQKKLDTDAEAVPCPSCRKYQRHMTAAARKIEWGWLRGVGEQILIWAPVLAFLVILVTVIAFPRELERVLIGAAIATGVLLLMGVLTGLAFHFTPCKPNRWSEAYRAAQAEALACTRAEFNFVALGGIPFVEDLTAGREAEYDGVKFLWVLPEEITEEAVVPYVTADGRPIEVELSSADDDGVFLDEDRVDDPEGGEYRICLRIFSVYRPRPVTSEAEDS